MISIIVLRFSVVPRVPDLKSPTNKGLRVPQGLVPLVSTTVPRYLLTSSGTHRPPRFNFRVFTGRINRYRRYKYIKEVQ